MQAFLFHFFLLSFPLPLPLPFSFTFTSYYPELLLESGRRLVVAQYRLLGIDMAAATGASPQKSAANTRDPLFWFAAWILY
jgi:hypothetical protein